MKTTKVICKNGMTYGEATIHLNLDAKMSQDELTKLLKEIGLG